MYSFTKGKRTIVSAGNRQCGRLSVRTIVSADNCHEDICQGGHLSKNCFSLKTYHVGYRWRGLDFKIVDPQFIVVVCVRSVQLLIVKPGNISYSHNNYNCFDLFTFPLGVYCYLVVCLL